MITDVGTVVRISDSPPLVVGSVVPELVGGREPDSAFLGSAAVVDGSVVAVGYVPFGQEGLGVVLTSTDRVTWTVVYEGSIFNDVAGGRGILAVGSSLAGAEYTAAYLAG